MAVTCGFEVHGRAYYARRPLAIGRLATWSRVRDLGPAMPLPQHGLHQLITSAVPAARSLRTIRQELDGNAYGSTQQDINDLTTPVSLRGDVRCGQHPVVLLSGLIRRPVRAAVLRSGKRLMPRCA